MSNTIKKAVIPAAGLGTRSLPATKVVPKELLPIVDKPGIQLIVEEALSAGVEEIIFVISPEKQQIVNHFKPAPALEKQLLDRGLNNLYEGITALQKQATYTVVYQHQPLGLGHAVLCAKEAVGNNWFFVFLPDDLIDHEVPCAVQMLDCFHNHEQPILAVMEVPWDEVHHYGVVKAQPLANQLGKIESVIEKPQRDKAPSNLAIVGRYLMPPLLFDLLEKTKPGAIGEIQLTDALLTLTKSHELMAFQFAGERFDVGSKSGFVEANIHYALKNAETRDKTLQIIKLLAESR